MELARSIATLLRSGLEVLFRPAPDPRNSYVYAASRQGELLERVQAGLAEVTAAKGTMEARQSTLREKLPWFEVEAREALVAGQERLARLALQRRELVVVELRSVEAQTDKLTQEEQRLALLDRRLTGEIKSFLARREANAARQTAAEAQIGITNGLDQMTEELSDLTSMLQSAEAETETVHEKTTALDDMLEKMGTVSSAAPAGDRLEHELALLDVAESVEMRLAELKRDVGPAAGSNP